LIVHKVRIFLLWNSYICTRRIPIIDRNLNTYNSIRELNYLYAGVRLFIIYPRGAGLFSIDVYVVGCVMRHGSRGGQVYGKL
jgi:hypothetical protein